MTYARSDIVEPGLVATYHCVSRCVRRAFLCGSDPLSGISFEHRRQWIRARLSALLGVFALEVIAYAVMSNHLHCLVRLRPDAAAKWSDDEVALRWRKLFPLRRLRGKPLEPSADEIKAITSNSKRVSLYRERLSSISWFNRCLNENIARRANAEDRCTGRFWEGRFKCQRVYDLAGILACSAYIDLNPVRAGMAKTLEGSDHTSIQDRLFKRLGKSPARHKAWTKVALLSWPEITDNAVSLDDYVKLVSETGKLIVEGKATLSAQSAEIIERLKINPERWVEATQEFKHTFRRVVGPEALLRKAALRAGKFWFQGLRAARRIFGTPLAPKLALS